MSNVITEGPLDAFANRAKLAGHAAMAGLGSKKADGRLKTAQVATTLYNNYQKYLGATKTKASKLTLEQFLKTKTVLEDQFIEKWVSNFDSYLNSSDKKQFIAQYDIEKDKDLILNVEDDQDVGDSQEDHVTDEQVEQYDGFLIPNGASWVDIAERVKLFKPFSETKEFHRVETSSIWSKLSSGTQPYKYDAKQDGSVVWAKDLASAKVVRNILTSNKSIVDKADALYDAGLLSDLKTIRAKCKSLYGDANALYMYRDAMMSAAKYIGLNYSEDLKRFVFMMPTIIANYHLVTGGGIKVNLREDDETSKVAGSQSDAASAATSPSDDAEQKKEENASNQLSDGKLRDFFNLMAHSAYFSGYIRESIAEAITESISNDARALINSILEDTVAADIATVPGYLGATEKPKQNKSTNEVK